MRYLWVSLIALLLIISCSGEGDEEGNGSAIDRATKEVADEAVKRIKTPIEKAEAVKDIEEARHEKFEEQSN